jgi:hypothetical protein
MLEPLIINGAINRIVRNLSIVASIAQIQARFYMQVPVVDYAVESWTKIKTTTREKF